MQSLSIKSLDILIGLLFLICLSFGLAYIGMRQSFPNQDISHPFVIIGTMFSIVSIGFFAYIYNKFFVTTITPNEPKIHKTKIVEEILQWLDNQSSFDTKLDTKYLITIISLFSFLGLVIYSIINWIL